MAKVISTVDREAVGEHVVATNADIDRAVTVARQASRRTSWAGSCVARRARGDPLNRRRSRSKKRESDLVSVLVEEVGTPVSQLPVSLGFVGAVFDYYANLAETYQFERQVVVGPAAGIVVGEPVGVVGAIVPVERSGDAVRLEDRPGAGRWLHRRLQTAPRDASQHVHSRRGPGGGRLPPGVLNIVPGGREVGEHLVTHPGQTRSPSPARPRPVSGS